MLEGNSQGIVEKAQCFVHFTYAKSGEQLVLDVQGNESTLIDPETATTTLLDEKKQILFCSGNLFSHALNGSLFLMVATNSVS